MAVDARLVLRTGPRVTLSRQIFSVGSTVRVWIEVRDRADDALVDGAVLSAIVYTPDATTASLALTEESTGIWFGDVETSLISTHTIHVTLSASEATSAETASLQFDIGPLAEAAPVEGSAEWAAAQAVAAAVAAARATQDVPGLVADALVDPLAAVDAAQSAAEAAQAAAQASEATAAQAASSTLAAASAAVYARAETLAALTAAMASAPVGDLGEVWGVNADEGVYRKLTGGVLSRVSDTARQISGWQESYKYVIADAEVEATADLTENASFMLSDADPASPTGRRLMRTSLADLIARGYQPRVARLLTADYTLVATDFGRTLYVTGDDIINLTVPAGLGAFSCRLSQLGGGPIKLVAGAGVTISPGDGWGTGGENTFCSLVALGSDQGVEQYQIAGDVALINTPGAPIISGPSTVYSLAENAPIGAIASYYTIAVTGNYPVDVQITGGDPTGRWGLDQALRNIVVAAPLDYEAAQSYSLELTATGPGGSSTTTVQINVTDIAPPVVIAGQQFAVFENTNDGAVIGTLRANRPVTSWSISSGLPFSVNEAGQLIKSGTLSAAGMPTYTPLVVATDSEGSSVETQITISIVAAGAVYSPAGDGAVAVWAMDNAAYRTISSDGTAEFSSLRDVLGGAGYEFVQSANWQTTAPRPKLVTGASGINGIDAMQVSSTRALYAPTGSGIKTLSNNRSVIAWRSVIVIDDDSVSGEIYRMTTQSSASQGRVIWRVDQSTSTAKFAVSARRFDTDTAVTVIHPTALVAGVAYSVYCEINYVAGTIRIVVNGVSQTRTVSWTSGTGPTVATSSAQVTLGYSNSVPSYWRMSLFAAMVAVPDESERVKNDLILAAKFGVSS